MNFLNNVHTFHLIPTRLVGYYDAGKVNSMSNLNAANTARLTAALDKLIRIDGKVMTYRQFVADASVADKTTFDGMIGWDRRKFNGMNEKEQRAYEARLKARTYYAVRGVIVPKLVYDSII